MVKYFEKKSLHGQEWKELFRKTKKGHIEIYNIHIYNTHIYNIHIYNIHIIWIYNIHIHKGLRSLFSELLERPKWQIVFFSGIKHNGDTHGDTSTTSNLFIQGVLDFVLVYFISSKYFILSVPFKSDILSALFWFWNFFLANNWY